MKVLITGANGQVGQELVAIAKAQAIPCVALSKTELDIADAATVTSAIQQHQPTIVMNAAAYTAVDKAEYEPDLAQRVNADGPARLAAACQQAAIPLIHLSTDYVFDGTATTPYSESSPVSPLGIYGKTKLAGERQIIDLCERYIIVRTSWVFGQYGHNFVRTMLRLATSHEALSVVDDQQGKPTCAADIAQALMAIAKQVAAGKTAWGVYHFAGDEIVSWCEFARAVFEIANKSVTVKAITTADYPTKAERPAYSVLATQKITDTFGITSPSWRTALLDVVQQLEKIL